MHLCVVVRKRGVSSELVMTERMMNAPAQISYRFSLSVSLSRVHSSLYAISSLHSLLVLSHWNVACPRAELASCCSSTSISSLGKRMLTTRMLEPRSAMYSLTPLCPLNSRPRNGAQSSEDGPCSRIAQSCEEKCETSCETGAPWEKSEQKLVVACSSAVRVTLAAELIVVGGVRTDSVAAHLYTESRD